MDSIYNLMSKSIDQLNGVRSLMSDQMIEITILVPVKDIYIDVNRIDHDKGDWENPEVWEVDIEEVVVDGLKYDIIEYDDSAIDELAIERASE